MSFALSVITRSFLALLLGLGPLGAEVVAALGHAELCGCCRSGMSDPVCCGDGEETSDSPRYDALDEACSCALVAPSRAPWVGAVRATEAGTGSRVSLERAHRAVEVASIEVGWPAPSKESTPAPPGAHPGPGAGPPCAGALRGSLRAAALGVLRL